MTNSNTPSDAGGLVKLAEVAAHHERQGLLCAKWAMINSPWKHDHAQNTAMAANHFAVAAAIRAIASEQVPQIGETNDHV